MIAVIIQVLKLAFDTVSTMPINLLTNCFVPNPFQSYTEEVVHTCPVTPIDASFRTVQWPDVSGDTVHSRSVLTKQTGLVTAVCCPNVVHIIT